MAGAGTLPDPFSSVFDVVVVGSGFAGFAAAISLRRRGRSVLLIGQRGDLVWEAGRAFSPEAGDTSNEDWRTLTDQVRRRGGSVKGWLDGAITEVVATDELLRGGTVVLYYALPVAVERAGEAVTSLTVATKAGLRRIVGRQWVDASENGALLRLLGPESLPRAPEQAKINLVLQHSDWSIVAGADQMRSTAWPTERVLSVEVKPGDPAWRDLIPQALADLEELVGADIADISMSHLSVEPVARYGAGVPVRVEASNVVSAVPGLAGSATATLADRFMLGATGGDRLARCARCEPAANVWTRPLPRPEVTGTASTDVCVVGAGTGGAIAALTASMAGAEVTCLEPSTFVGGIGAGGGIHGYFYGVAGGFQREVDRRVHELMKRFGRGPLGDGAFNPWAKMLALEQMMRERHVALHTGALAFGVEMRGNDVAAVLAATSSGVLRVEAGAFVDGTGDGDLCALAGAKFAGGRAHDGLLHPYTQSSGILDGSRGRPRMGFVNFVAGFCDPTDPVDMTRARTAGILQYLMPEYGNFDRPTYIAPSLGIRQSRQIVTEYTLTLDDQVRGRRFDDAVGYTGAHVENLATDFQFGSDESVFWTWLNRQWTTPVACQLSYRMLVPRGLSNVWIGSRCLGVSQDAHYATRMQRDMQRVGEVAGFAAAEAVRLHRRALQLPYVALRKWLDRTGALEGKSRAADTRFGAAADHSTMDLFDEEDFAGPALAALDRGEPGKPIWWLYQHHHLVGDAVVARLDGARDEKPLVSWLAAGIVAMWSDSAAEPRLIEAIEGREFGFDDADRWAPRGYNLPDAGFGVTPLTWAYVVPNWLCAIALLRRCGTEACLPALDRLVAHPVHGLDTLTTVAITLEQLLRRGILSEKAYPQVERILDRLLAVRVVGAVDYAGRPVGRHSDCALRGRQDDGAAAVPLAPGLPVRAQLPNTYVDATWQLHFAVAGARGALSLPVHDAAKPYECDERAYVRRAFGRTSAS